jgi:hypothetical protein
VIFIFSFTGCKTTSKTVAETTEAVKITEAAATATTTVSAETTAVPEITTQPVQENADYKIGDTGPAGGFIFYVNPNYKSDGWKYLEAAPGDFPGNNNDYRIQWWNGNYVETGATGIAIGTGMSNTQKIVNIQGEYTGAISCYAAKLCSDLTQGGYSDWFLPSLGELNLMYKNLQLKGIGSFEPEIYWSSSENDRIAAWCQGFQSGSTSGTAKGLSHYEYGSIRVRAVRAFN